MKLQIKAKPQKCETCPFRADHNRLKLPPSRMAEIYSYLSQGVNHWCHSDQSNTVACRGGRDFQLQVFFVSGFIDEPTDKALEAAMEKIPEA